MGFHCAWIASRAARARVLAHLNFSAELQSEEPVYDPGLYGIALPSGWYVVFGGGWDFMGKLGEGQASELSRDSEALFFTTDDTSMSTQLVCFQGGELAWAITYDGSNGVGEPELEGQPPAVLAETLARVRKAQEGAGGKKAGVDHIYDLTAEVGRLLVGFRHDQTLGDDEVPPIDLLA